MYRIMMRGKKSNCDIIVIINMSKIKGCSSNLFIPNKFPVVKTPLGLCEA